MIHISNGRPTCFDVGFRVAWGYGCDFDSVIPRGTLSPKGPVGSLIVRWEMDLVLDGSPPIFVRNTWQASVLRRQSPASVGWSVSYTLSLGSFRFPREGLARLTFAAMMSNWNFSQ